MCHVCGKFIKMYYCIRSGYVNLVLGTFVE